MSNGLKRRLADDARRPCWWLACLWVGPLMVIGLPWAMADGFPFPQRGRTTADAVILEHAAKRLAAGQAGADTPEVGRPPQILPPDEVRIRTRLHRLTKSLERYTELARRNAGYQMLQEQFRQLSHDFAEVGAMAEIEDSPLTRGRLREDWLQLQQAFDQAYFDLYGFDALDPYFGRHPDFAAWPDNHFHPRDYWRPRSSRAAQVPAYRRFIDQTESGIHWQDVGDPAWNQQRSAPQRQPTDPGQQF